nr:hypothetical protein CFP56_77803 [Quercus suber]
MANQTSSCIAGSLTPIVLNDASVRVCGVGAASASILEPCCDGNEIHSAQCTHYCNTKKTMMEFVTCITKDGKNTSSVPDMNPFCQESIVGNTTETLTKTSYGARRANPLPMQYLFFALLVVLLSATNASATIVKSLSPEIGRRQSGATSSCAISVHSNYTTIRNSQQISPHFTCDGNDYCVETFSVETDILKNNRTINGASASEPKYDDFFEKLENSTGRMFPALSGITLQYDYVTSPGIEYFIDFTPYAWCINGTVSNCGQLLGGSNDAAPVDICGPLFISDNDETSRVTFGDDVIQGVFSTVSVG